MRATFDPGFSLYVIYTPTFVHDFFTVLRDSSCKMLGTKRDGVVARAEITNGEKLGYVEIEQRIRKMLGTDASIIGGRIIKRR